jgi:hypothetical protein
MKASKMPGIGPSEVDNLFIGIPSKTFKGE